MKETIREALETVAAIYKWRNQLYGNYMYNRPEDMGKIGRYVMVYAILDGDGKSTLYELNLGPRLSETGKIMNVEQWSNFLQKDVSGILKSRVLPFMSSRHGGTWRVRGVVGWRFMAAPPDKPKRAASKRGGKKGE